MPLFLTILLVAYFSVCGRAWLAIFGVNVGRTRNWLLAPSLGVALNALFLLILNQAGWPVARFAPTLAACFLMGSVGILLWRRAWDMHGLAPFAVIALASLVVGGWPALQMGFQWISFGNDDMTNYCLAAQRMMHDGFYRVPDIAELAGTDPSQFYWFMHVVRLMRPGCELLLAGIAATTGRPPVDIFMATIFALAVTQLWALCALLYSSPRRRAPALIAGGLLAISPLWHYGTLQQLIAQVAGLALLFAGLAVTARARFARSQSARWRQAAVIGLLAAGLAIIYPEVTPFLVLSLALYLAARLVRTRRLAPGTIVVGAFSAAVMIMMLRHNALGTVVTVLGQTAGGLTQEDISQTIFPYFLMPKGLSLLFGLEAIMRPWSGMLASVTIGSGLILLIFLLVAGLRGAWRLRPASSLLVVMAAVGFRLFLGNNGFGLFKLAMFITPGLLAELSIWLAGPGQPWLKRGLALVLTCTWLAISQDYVRTTLPGPANVYLEISEASRSRGDVPAGPAAMVMDLTNSPVAKFAHNLPGTPAIASLSRPFFKGIMEMRAYDPPAWVWRWMPLKNIPGINAELERQAYEKIFVPQNAFGTIIWPDRSPWPPHPRLLTSLTEIRSFNKLGAPAIAPDAGLFQQSPLMGEKNHLVFIHSKAGQHYYLGDAGTISVYKPQPDFYLPGGYFFAIGRNLVFQIVQPQAPVRLRLSLTTSILGEGHTQLPEQAVARDGTGTAISLGIVGSGSANVYSPPLRPLGLNGRDYLAIDLGRVPFRLPPGDQSGFSGLYNRSVNLDPRFINGYCRDISLISDADYQHLKRPTALARFPEDLLGQHTLEYSGIYEDGWLSRESFVVLGPVEPGSRVVIRGMIPSLPDGSLADNELEVLLNGQAQPVNRLTLGEFTITCPVGFSADCVRIDLRFSREGRLPLNDQRPVTALLTSLTLYPEH